MATTTTTTTKTHSQPRLGLKARMSGGRRLPRPDASSPSATPATYVEQKPQLFLTYSQFLRNFDATPISFNEDYRHRPSFAISPFSEPFSDLDPGPSKRHSGFYPSDERQDFVPGHGWQRDREQWLGHARIEEVDDDDDVMGANPRKSNVGLGNNFATARVQSISTAFASTSKDDEASNHSPDDMPLEPKPTAGSKLRTFYSFKPTSTGSEYHSLQPTSTASAAIPPPVNSIVPLDDATEVSLVREVLNLLMVSQEDVKFMNTVRFILSMRKQRRFSS